jgi:hypothetical protein
MNRRKTFPITPACVSPPGARAAIHSRTAAAGIAIIIVLVFVQLIIVGSVVTGTRDQDTTVQRLDTLRAFYAAEGGMNMAIREMIGNADEDADTIIGSISNDGNTANDPTIGTARVYVAKDVVGATSNLTSRGRAGAARRQLTASVE